MVKADLQNNYTLQLKQEFHKGF